MEPTFTEATERMYERLPEVYRTKDEVLGWPFKRWVSGIGDVVDEVDTLVERFDYNPPEDGGVNETSELVDPSKAEADWLKWLGQLLSADCDRTRTKIVLFDTYARTVASGVGNAETGQVYTIQGGLASNYSVNGTHLAIQAAVKGTEYIVIPTITPLSDFDITFVVNSADMTADAGSNNPRFQCYTRYVDSNNYVLFKAWYTSGNITVSIDWRIGGVSGGGLAFPAITSTTINSSVTIRCQGVGNLVRVMGWLTGNTPPTTWHREEFVTHVAAGGVRLSGIIPAAYSGTVPKNWTVDSLIIKAEDNSLESLRDCVKSNTGTFRAGTKPFIIEAAQSVLIGNQTVYLYDHTTAVSAVGGGTEWDLLVLTVESETAGDPIAAIIAAGAKPAGVKLWHKYFGATWATIEANRPTWADWEAAGNWRGFEETGL